MRLLEFNNFWLFYYLVFFYDEDGTMSRMDRKAWYEMMGIPMCLLPVHRRSFEHFYLSRQKSSVQV